MLVPKSLREALGVTRRGEWIMLVFIVAQEGLCNLQGRKFACPGPFALRRGRIVGLIRSVREEGRSWLLKRAFYGLDPPSRRTHDTPGICLLAYYVKMLQIPRAKV